MAIIVRDANEDDVDSIVASHNAAWRRAYRELFPAEYLDGEQLLERQRSKWTERFTAGGPTYPVRVAEDAGKVIGFSCFEQAERESHVELTGVYVEPYHWSTGAGSALLRDARDIWKAQGYSEAFAWVAVNNPRAHRSYKKNNWEITEEKSEHNIDGHIVPVEKLTLAL